MKIFIALFKKEDLNRKIIKLFGNQLKEFKNVFPNYSEESKNIDKGIVYFKGKANNPLNCYIVDIRKIDLNEDQIIIEFDPTIELDEDSEKINKRLYRFAIEREWVNKKTGFFPIICITDDNSFDNIRKGTSSRTKCYNNLFKVEENKKNSDWISTCNMYEPLEELSKNIEVWNNSNELYEIGFACSKLGELQNGKEKDKGHLSFIKRHRDLSIKIYKRCYELEPDNSQYSSAVAYRHYQNFNELKKQKGRKDGIKQEEFKEAVNWFDISLKIHPKNIKNNYRKGKIVSDYIDIFKYNQKEQNKWTKGKFNELTKLESTLENCFVTTIDAYNNMNDDKRKSYNKNEYVKSLYNLGTYYLEKINILNKYDYAISLLLKIDIEFALNVADKEYLSKSYNLFKKCIQAETTINIEEPYDYNELLKSSQRWAESPSDKYYRMGLVYLNYYYINMVLGKNSDTAEKYGTLSELYFNTAYKIAKNLGKNKNFIADKLAWYYILHKDYNKAISLTQYIKDAYAINTYVTAMMLSDFPDKHIKAEKALNQANENKYNLAVDTTKSLLGCLSNLKG